MGKEEPTIAQRKEDTEFFKLAMLQLGVFLSAVLAFLLSMAWNNVFVLYTKNTENEKKASVIYAVILTVAAVTIMASFVYFTVRHSSIETKDLTPSSLF